MDIRPATIDDLRGVLDLWEKADAEPTYTDDPLSLARLVSHDSSALMIAVDGDRLVGSVIATWDGWRGSIYRLAVVPDRRREGVARHLLDAAEMRLNSVGAVRLQATVVATQSQARSFWRASGWEEQIERLRFVKG